MRAFFTERKWESRTFVLGVFIFVISYFTYFHYYGYPAALFWDENYHIASAQKYLNGVFFMEPHPPLGKLLVAAGEKLLHMNDLNNQFITTDYGSDLPAGFSFVGYRFFPTLLAWLTAPVLYLVFLRLTRKDIISAVFTFLYVFDNALIVHSRGAMLDGILMFFCCLTILGYLKCIDVKEDPKKFRWASVLFGAALGAVAVTKLNGLVLVLLVPALLWKLWPNMKRMVQFAVPSLIAFLLVFVAVWQTHFALGKNVMAPLPDNGYYQASDAYKQIITSGAQWSPISFAVMLRDSMKYVDHYEAGVPQLDLCKADENGSPFFFWPVGARAINYRWETPNSQVYQYLYLQVNPVVWWISFAGVIAAVGLLLASVVLPLKEQLPNRYQLMVFTGIYVAYMVAIARLDRVMYLYHYFIPLMFSFLILSLVFMCIQRVGKWLLTDERRNAIALALGVLIFLGFQFYRPLSYYEPISDAAFKRRMLLPLWGLRCVNCERVNTIATPN